MTLMETSDIKESASDSLASAVRAATEKLASQGVPSARHDAEAIAAHLLGTDRTALWRYLQGAVPTGFDDLVNKRCARIPLQHLTGTAYFRTISLSVGPGVFIPRPETEIVVEAALALLDQGPTQVPVVVDLCAGAGPIAVAVAVERPQSQVHAVEADPGAIPWLKSNAEQGPVHVHEADVLTCLPHLGGQVDVIIANPPYIPTDAVPRDLEVARYDPAMALYSGDDGLSHMRMVEQTARRLLKPSGWAVIEHGDLQGTSAPGVFSGQPEWTAVQGHVDLNGRDRFFVAQRSAVS